MLRCREVSELVSRSLDEPLPLITRMRVAFHLAMCGMCRGFARQLRWLRKLVRREAAEGLPQADDRDRLSQTAKDRIKTAIRNFPADG
ncbi:hypothetical protein JCM19992_00400 [Thermostilla marina]